ncbi:MAG: dihydrodipicolinate synthase family protein [Fidelibacterota bacterium]|nr:MAG: dihydrodipicolinate synthase family protein [Candidatus Neomarinimicrobiota bacterium]
MSDSTRIAGPFAPILTPFSPDRSVIDHDSFRQHLAFIEDAGLAGVLVLGTNGEFTQLTIDERLQLIDVTLSAGTGLKIIIGVTVPDSPDRTLAFMEQMTVYAGELTAVLVAPPFYNRYTDGNEVSSAEVVVFYRQLSKVQDRIPVFLYNVPVPPDGRTTAAVTPDMVAELESDPIFAGIKDSTARLENIPAYLGTRSNFQVLLGSDHIIAEGLSLGAVGSITACGNVFPGAVRAVYAAQPGPDLELAQVELTALRRILEVVPGKAVAIQKLLLFLQGIVEYQSPVREAQRELTDPEKDVVLGKLSEAAEGLRLNRDLAEAILRQL